MYIAAIVSKLKAYTNNDLVELLPSFLTSLASIPRFFSVSITTAFLASDKLVSLGPHSTGTCHEEPTLLHTCHS